MTKTYLVGPAFALVAVVAAAACGGSGSTPSTTPAPASAPAAAAPAPAPSSSMGNMNMGGRLPAGVTAAMVAQGDSIFHAKTCKNCHGEDGKGGPRAPDLTAGKYLHGSGSMDDIVKVITNGVPVADIVDKSRTIAMRARGGMPPLTDDQIKLVAAYVYTLGHK